MRLGKLEIDPAHAVAILVIATAVLAGVWHFQQIPRSVPGEWRTLQIAENNFALAAPGLFTVNRQTMSFGGEEIPAQTYLTSNLDADFSVLVTPRPNSDARSFAQVAKEMKATGADSPQQVGDLTIFRHDVIIDGKRTQAALIFHDRMMYQLMITAPAKTFSTANAERFFTSFHLIGPASTTGSGATAAPSSAAN